MGIFCFRNNGDYKKYFKISIKYGDPLGYSFYASTCRQLGNYQQSFELYKNAIYYGNKSAYLGIAKLFAIGNPP